MIKQYSFVLIQLNDFHTGIKFITLRVKSDKVNIYRYMQRGISMYEKVVTIVWEQPLKQLTYKKVKIVNCAEAKICHFPFLDLGGREVLCFPSILCKIVVHSWVAPGPKNMSLVPIHIPGWTKARHDEVARLRLEPTDPGSHSYTRVKKG